MEVFVANVTSLLLMVSYFCICVGQNESEFEAAKKTIESLHQQLMELEKSESLSRAREQHENVVMATRKRCEEEVVRLKQKLDDVNNTLLWKVRQGGWKLICIA